MNTAMNTAMNIVEYSNSYSKEVTDVFYQSVHAIDNGLYSLEQKSVWAPYPIDYQKWQTRLRLKSPYVLLINERIAGFIELEDDGHIDCMYVLPKFQRRSVGSELLKYTIHKAKAQGITQLYVEASLVAKPLFERFGFVCKQKNRVRINNVVLENYTMTLRIDRV